ncbi:tetratricopeptide repeat protein [Nostoc sp. DedVER01b]|uniref:tetratricopeptide repeat protein n=1 Tax=Nostoc sp. DedVER01b TaxID=3075404 RepID=UPI002AD4EBBD|nr:tetratricopeptide repeat protein [Nostoc sp. DedVER01b]MDZ8113756.1 tetratricopeptide repeat protein [Nostoc sp. DedVER01b]
MNHELLQKLAKAQTDEERSWIVTESLLSTLSPELASAAYAAAVPHWFNADILAALRPELQAQSSQLYTELQTLPFVEEFFGRGHNVHDLTRNLMLKHLWHEHQDEFLTLSQRAAEYFFSSNERQKTITEQPETQIEWLYHLIVVDREWKGSEFWDLAQKWNNNFRVAELESLITTLLEQIAAERVATPAKAEVYYFAGKAEFRVYKVTKALERYEAALAFYRDIGDHLGEANTLIAIGNVLQFLKRSTEALERYEAALAFYRDIGDRLGEANTLIAIGDVLQFLKRSTEALERYEAALAFYRDTGSRLGEANTLVEIGILQENLTLGLEYCQAALELYTQIGDKYSQSRNLIYFTSKILLKLGRQKEAVDALNRAIDLAREVPYEIFVEYATAKLREIQVL